MAEASYSSSSDYNTIVGRLQEALLHKQVTAEDYERLKKDLIHPSTNLEDPVGKYNSAIHRLQKQFLKHKIDADTYERLKNDLIRPDGQGARPAAAPSSAAAVAPPAAPPPAPAKEPAASAAPAAPASKPAPKPPEDKAKGVKVTFAVPSLRELIEKHHEPGVHALIAQHPQIADSVQMLQSKIEELERKGEFSPTDLATIKAFEDIMQVQREKAAR